MYINDFLTAISTACKCIKFLIKEAKLTRIDPVKDVNDLCVDSQTGPVINRYSLQLGGGNVSDAVALIMADYFGVNYGYASDFLQNGVEYHLYDTSSTRFDEEGEETYIRILVQRVPID